MTLKNIGNKPRSYFINDILLTIQIQKYCFVVIIILLSLYHNIFVHSTTAELSDHLQNDLAITLS